MYRYLALILLVLENYGGATRCVQILNSNNFNCSTNHVMELSDIFEKNSNIDLEFSSKTSHTIRTNYNLKSLTIEGSHSNLVCDGNEINITTGGSLELYNISMNSCNICCNNSEDVKIYDCEMKNMSLKIRNTVSVAMEYCTFESSIMRYDRNSSGKRMDTNVTLKNIVFSQALETALQITLGHYSYNSSFLIADCNFSDNAGHISIGTTKTGSGNNNISINCIKVEGSNFQKSRRQHGVSVSLQIENKERILNLEFQDCNFSGEADTLQLKLYPSDSAFIHGCYFQNNYIGLSAKNLGNLTISDTKFVGNSRAIESSVKTDNIRNCYFKNNSAKNMEGIQTIVLLKSDDSSITNTIFRDNDGMDMNCTVVYIDANSKISIENSTIRDNNCSGILLLGSHLTINQILDISGNKGEFGGGLRMHYHVQPRNILKINEPKLEVLNNSQLILEDNFATVHGGGIYIDRPFSCSSDSSACFFHVPNFQNYYFKFQNTSAGIAGDAIFGGCLSHCHIGNTTIDATNKSNIFFNIAKIHSQSASLFAEPPIRVAFCNESGEYSNNGCSNASAVEPYPGQKFSVSLMIVDGSCSASRGTIRAKLAQEGIATLKDIHQCQQSVKYCNSYEYLVNGDSNTTIIMELYMGDWTANNPAILKITLRECPQGFHVNLTEGCLCQEVIQEAGIKCSPENHTFTVPELTWIGMVDEKLAFSKFCRRCLPRMTPGINLSHSELLCTLNRTGVLCGECEQNLSLRLGGYSCDNCSDKSHLGVIYIVFSVLMGIVLVLAIFKLNLNISTGMLNGFILYSNIIYFNSDAFIHISRDEADMNTNRVVNFLFVLQAWVNLDLGIDTCFFDKYDDYQAVWIQFLFPLYLLFLIFVVFIISKYSIRISKMTGSNTVPALATIAILSFTKILAVILVSLSITEVTFVDSTPPKKLWIQGSNIAYGHGKHISLFILSVMIGFLYIIPFTLLIALGPVLQSLSHYRPLKWVAKLKPFFDAFYGPHSDIFRYWPGILLILRLIVLVQFASFSLNEGRYKLVVISVSMFLLILLLLGMEEIKSQTIYRNKKAKYLELFYLSNLTLYSITTLYFYNAPNIQKKQIVTVIFLGSALVIFLIIIFQHVYTHIGLVKKPFQYIYSHFCLKLKLVFPIRKSISSMEAEITEKENMSMNLREPLIDN